MKFSGETCDDNCIETSWATSLAASLEGPTKPSENLDRFEIDLDAGTEPRVVQWTHERKGEIQFKGTYGYVIKPHAAQKLIDAAYSDGITASDMFMKQRYVNLQLVKPRAVYVSSKQSLSSDRSFDM